MQMTRPLLLGHRGARAFREIPENTIASFELCLRHGCDGFEFDVRQAADGEVVVFHDPQFGGLPIAETSANKLKLPTLGEVLARFSSRAFLDIELKVAGLEQQVTAELRSHPPRQGYLVSSFLPHVLSSMQKIDLGVPLGFICEDRGLLERWRDLPVEWMIPRSDLVTAALPVELMRAGKKIMVWTVNDAGDMARLAEWGVNGIISDQTLELGRLRSR